LRVNRREQEINMNIDFRTVFKLTLWSFPGCIIGFFLVAALLTAFTQGFGALPLILIAPLGASSLLSALGQAFVFALMFGLSTWQYLAAGLGVDLRRVLILGLIWGGLNLVMGLFQWPGVILILATFWQGVAMAVGAFFTLRFMR
jgi:hypothetical protein